MPLLKLHLGVGALLNIYCIFSEHLFLLKPLDGCFWIYYLNSSSCSAKEVLKNYIDFLQNFNLFLTLSLTLFTNMSIAIISSLCFILRLPSNFLVANIISKAIF